MTLASDSLSVCSLTRQLSAPQTVLPCFLGHSKPFQSLTVRSLSDYQTSSNGSNSDGYHRTLKALQSKNRSPKKWLGQHYMLNPKINEKLVQIAKVEKGDVVLEIGPGTGALTSSLVEAGAYVIAVEKDPDMAELITERFLGNDHVKVVHEDFMKLPVRTYMDSLITSNFELSKPAKVVSNLPFNITTSVIKRILPLGDIFACMVLLIQDEAAFRLVEGAPKMNEYRPISLFVQYFSDPQYKEKVDRSNFFPRPNVDAAVVSFKIKPTSKYPSVVSTKSFFTLVNSAFGGKRKMLRNSLQHLYPPADVQMALKLQNLLESARPDELSLHQFVALHNALELLQEKSCTSEIL